MTQTPAHLLKLSGMGDTCWKLLDATDWSYLKAFIDMKASEEPPHIPDSTRQNALDYLAKENSDQSIEDILLPDIESSGSDNELALIMPPSSFHGETFYTYSPTIKDLLEFAAKHNLEVIESYEGYIY